MVAVDPVVAGLGIHQLVALEGQGTLHQQPRRKAQTVARLHLVPAPQIMAQAVAAAQAQQAAQALAQQVEAVAPEPPVQSLDHLLHMLVAAAAQYTKAERLAQAAQVAVGLVGQAAQASTTPAAPETTIRVAAVVVATLGLTKRAAVTAAPA